MKVGIPADLEKRLRHIPSGRARAIVRSGVKRVEIMLGTVVDINRKATTDYSPKKNLTPLCGIGKGENQCNYESSKSLCVAKPLYFLPKKTPAATVD